MARNTVSCGHDDAGKAFDLLASVVRFPDRHDRNRGRFRCRPPVSRLAVRIGFAVVMAQVRRPVPFRTRKLRPGTAMVLHSRGCGRVARRRIQRWTFWSSPLGDSRKVFFFYSHRVFSSARWGIMDVGKPACGRIPPVGGGFRTVEGLWAYWLFQ